MIEKQRFTKILYLGLAVLSSILYLIIIFGFRKSIDGDIIGDLIIAKEGLTANRIYSESVFYSTALQNVGSVLIHQLFLRLGLSFYSTYFAACIIEMISYFLLLYLFLKNAGLADKIFLIWAVLLLPTYPIFYLVFAGKYYLWSLIDVLFLLCIYSCYQKEKKKRFLLITAFFSLYKGLMGIKALMWVFVPMSLALFLIGYWKKNKSSFILGCATLIPSLPGMLINEKILLGKYGISSRSGLQYVLLEEVPDRISKAVLELLKAFGWQDGAQLLSCSGIINVIVILSLLFMIYLLAEEINHISKIDEFDALFFGFSLFSMALMFFLLTFTKADMNANYLALSCWAVILNCCIFYAKYYDAYFKKRLFPALLCLLVFFYGFSWKHMYKTFVAEQRITARENQAVLELLQSRGLKYGYGTFWNSQLIAGSSELEIESVNISISEDGFYYFQWLSPKKYYNKSYYDGRAFVVLQQYEKEGFDRVLTAAGGTMPEIIFDDGYYVIYEIENREMVNYIVG